MEKFCYCIALHIQEFESKDVWNLSFIALDSPEKSREVQVNNQMQCLSQDGPSHLKEVMRRPKSYSLSAVSVFIFVSTSSEMSGLE